MTAETEELNDLASSLCSGEMFWGYDDDPPPSIPWGTCYALYRISPERLRELAGQQARIAQLEAALSNLLARVGDPARVTFYPMDDAGNVDCLFCGGEYDEMNGVLVHDHDCAYFVAKGLLA